MGRRSINSTKAGKFINPTDQARKEARRKELKKNKKQRQQVREAVIKQKDPRTILNELDQLDKLEYDTNNPPPYTSTVINEKRRKLKFSFKKIYQFYQKEDAKLAYELKQLELDYDRRHELLKQTHESIMKAKKVNLDEIPLPDDNQPAVLPVSAYEIPFGLPPPPPPPASSIPSNTNTESTTPKSILKTSDSCSKLINKAPGPPPGSPPDLSEFQCDDDEFETGLTINESIPSDKTKKIRFTNETLLSSSSSSSNQINQFNQTYLAGQQYTQANKPQYNSNLQMKIQQQASRVAQEIYQQNAIRQQQQQQQQLSQQIQSTSNQNQTTTIEAKPVLRNKIAEVTRFVPTSLLVRRENATTPHQTSHQQHHEQFHRNQQNYDYSYKQQQQQQYKDVNKTNNKSTDAAYEDFMKEVSELL